VLKSLFVSILLLLFGYSHAFAGYYRSMSAEEVKKAVESKSKITVIDARTEKEFREGHIPGAINIPPEKLGLMGTLLPRDKNSLIIFYCRGAG
jgi:rhodanese-related sulfurtransferase